MKLYEIADIDFDTEDQTLSVNNDENGENDNQEIDYDRVFKAVAQHFDCDPESIDDQDQETREKVYDMMDKCWDSEEDKVSDSCPIDITSDDSEHEDDYQDDETSELDDET